MNYGGLFVLRLRGKWFLGITPVLVAVAVLLVDQASKMIMLSLLGHVGREPINVIGPWLRFALVTNSGAAFGLFQDRTLFFTAVAIIAIPTLIIFHNNLPSDSWLAKNCVGLLLGGTLGNLADRVRYGYVIDFIDAGIGNQRWPTFNVADSAFVIGVLILAFYFLFQTSAERANAGGTSSS